MSSEGYSTGDGGHIYNYTAIMRVSSYVDKEGEDDSVAVEGVTVQK